VKLLAVHVNTPFAFSTSVISPQHDERSTCLRSLTSQLGQQQKAFDFVISSIQYVSQLHANGIAANPIAAILGNDTRGSQTSPQVIDMAVDVAQGNHSLSFLERNDVGSPWKEKVIL
jgi:hypothetical protein